MNPLEDMILKHIAKGWILETATESWAVMLGPVCKPNHVVHAILFILTMGLWGFVWLPVALFSRPERQVLTFTVRVNGTVSRSISWRNV